MLGASGVAATQGSFSVGVDFLKFHRDLLAPFCAANA
jgi:hypothetical protein